jgi:Arc/MetJ family transcription regulator
MLRLTDIKLDLDHVDGEIKAAVLKRLDLKPRDLISYSVYRRAVDAQAHRHRADLYARHRGAERSGTVAAVRARSQCGVGA